MKKSIKLTENEEFRNCDYCRKPYIAEVNFEDFGECPFCFLSKADFHKEKVDKSVNFTYYRDKDKPLF